MLSPFDPVPRVPLAPDGLPVGMPSQHGIPTLGWGVLAWAEEYLAQPDGTNAGDPWRWTQSQARIIAWWYAVDVQGRWLYRRGQIVLPKGSGKVLSRQPCAAASSPVRRCSTGSMHTVKRSAVRTRRRMYSWLRCRNPRPTTP